MGALPPNTEESPANRTVRKNAQIALATTLQDLSLSFGKIQTRYKSRIAGTETTIQTLAGNMILAQNDVDEDPYGDKAFTEDQEHLLVTAETTAQSRHEEIAQIAESIHQLGQIFRDMHTMVLGQGTVLDRIDYNVEQVVTETGAAVTILTPAAKSQKKYTKKLLILLLIVIVVALAVFLLLRSKLSGSDSSSGGGGNIATTAPTPHGPGIR